MYQIPTEVTVACIAAIGSLLVSLVNAIAAWLKDKSDKAYRAEREKAERERAVREDQRHAMDEAMMDGIASALEGIDISLIALQGGHLNGNVEAARARVESSARQMRQVKDKTISKLL